MTTMEMAFRNACKKNEGFTGIVDTAAQNIASAKAAAEAAAKAAAEKKAAEEKAAIERKLEEEREKGRKALKAQIEKQNAMTLFGFSYSPMDYAMSFGIIWAENLEAARARLANFPKLSVWEVNRSNDVVFVGEYYE